MSACFNVVKNHKVLAMEFRKKLLTNPTRSTIMVTEKTEKDIAGLIGKRKSDFPWLMAAGDGALCSACSVYYANRPLPKGTKGVFIHTPFTNWKKSTGSKAKDNKLLKHNNSSIHNSAVACRD